MGRKSEHPGELLIYGSLIVVGAIGIVIQLQDGGPWRVQATLAAVTTVLGVLGFAFELRRRLRRDDPD